MYHRGMRASLMISVVLSLVPVLACGGGSDNPASDDGGPESDASDGTRPTVFGGDRPVEIRVPMDYDHATPTPLLFVLHGFGANGTVQAAYTGFDKLPDERGVIVVAPDGTTGTDGRNFWNATDACCDFGGTGVDDSGYLKGLVDEISAEWNIDAKRIFSFGHSNGGFMSFRLACDHADTFAALASLAGATYIDTAQCSPSQAVSVLQIHGDADATISYTGTAAAPGAVATVQTWATYNSCNPGTLEAAASNIDIEAALDGPETRVEIAAGCPQAGASELWTIETGSHVPSLTTDFHLRVYDWLELAART